LAGYGKQCGVGCCFNEARGLLSQANYLPPEAKAAASDYGISEHFFGGWKQAVPGMFEVMPNPH
jgi:hypothetical protein